MKNVIRWLELVFSTQKFKHADDAELMRCFLETRKSDTFAAILNRHGPMVFAVARRILGDYHLAEDVFQATFLILAKKAGAIRDKRSLPAWLHSVAIRLAVRAKKSRNRGRDHESLNRHPVSVDPVDDLTVRELRTILDQELRNLPEKYRLPLILCHLEGLTQEEAAKRLGLCSGALKGRLERGRIRLRANLAKHGLGLGTGLLGALELGDLAAAVPMVLRQTTLHAALTGQGASLGAVALANGAIKMMFLAKVQNICLAMLLLGAGGWGTGWLAQAGPASNEVAIQPPPARAENDDAPQKAREKRVDLFGDPLPDHAIQRIGTVRFRPGGLVYACAFSSDGKYLLASTENQGVVLFDMAEGRFVRRYGQFGSHAACAFSPDGTSVAANWYGSIARWDLSTGEPIRGINTPQQMIFSLAFTPDGKRIISGGEDNILRLSAVATGEELAKFEGHEGPIHSVAITPDGQYAVSGSMDMTVRLWNLTTGKMEREFMGRKPTKPGNPYAPVALSTDGKWLATSDGKPGVCIFEVDTGKMECRLPFDKPHPYENQDFYSLAFSHDGKMVAAGTATRQFLIWDRTTRELKQHREVWPSTTSRGWHRGGVPSVAFSPDDKHIAFAEDSRVALWDVAKGQDLEPADISAGFVHFLRFTRDGQSLVTGRDDPRMPLAKWDVKTGRLLRRLRGEFNCPGSFDFSADLRVLVSSSDEHMRFWDTESGKEVRKFKLPLNSRSVSLERLAFSPDGKRLAGGNMLVDKTARVWDAASGDEVCRLDFRNTYYNLTFAPDGKTLASAGDDQVLRIHDATTGKTLRYWPNPFGGLMCFSPDGSMLASHDAKGASELGNYPSRERVIRLWEAATGKLRRQLDLGDRGNGKPVFSPNGYMLAIAGSDGTTQIWEVATGKERRLLQGHRAPVTTLTFSPDGKSLASGSDDTTVLLWDAYAAPKAGKPESLDVLWTKLASNDAAQAFDAMTTLIHMPNDAVTYVRGHLQPIGIPDAKRIEALIDGLNSEQFPARRDASNGLTKLGDLAEPALTDRLAKQPSLETRQRIEFLLTKLNDLQGGESVRAVRAVEILESLGTPAAYALLETLAKGAPGHRQTRAAKEALRRR